MSISFKYNIIYILIVLASCNSQPVKNKKTGEIAKTDYKSSIIRVGQEYRIDTSIVLANKNLPQLIDSLNGNTLNSIEKYNEIPNFVNSFLQKISGDEFLIANKGAHFAVGCNRSDNEPFRQVQFIGLNDKYLVMSYKIGGIGLMGHVLILKFEKQNIIDFWVGGGSLDLDSKTKIINFLKENKNKPWGLNSTIIYL